MSKQELFLCHSINAITDRSYEALTANRERDQRAWMLVNIGFLFDFFYSLDFMFYDIGEEERDVS